MLPPSLQHGSGALTHSRRTAATAITPSARTMARLKLVTPQRRSLSWWSRKTHCLSQFNAANNPKCLKPSFRVRKLLKSPKIFQDRPASYWDRPGLWRIHEESGKQPQQDNKRGKDHQEDEGFFELSRAEKAWQQRMDALKRRLDEDPHDALFGRSNAMLRGVPWVPKWLKDEMGLNDRETEGSRRKDTESKVDADSPAAKSPKPDSCASATRTVAQHADGSPKPSTSPQADYEYDPISGKMVPKEASNPTQTPTKAQPDNDGWIDIPVKPFKPRGAHPTASQSKKTDTTATREFVPKETSIETDKTQGVESVDPLREALKQYEQREKQKQIKPSAPPEEQIAMNSSTVTKPTSSNSSQPRRPNLPADDIDLLRPSDVRATMGISKHPKKETHEQKTKQRERLEEEFEKAHEEVDVPPESTVPKSAASSDPRDAFWHHLDRELKVLKADREQILTSKTSMETESGQDGTALGALMENLRVIRDMMKGIEELAVEQQRKSTKKQAANEEGSRSAEVDVQQLIGPGKTVKGLASVQKKVNVLQTSLERYAAKDGKAQQTTTKTDDKQETPTLDCSTVQEQTVVPESEPAEVNSSNTATSGLSEDVNATAEAVKPPVDAWDYSTIPQGLEPSYAEEVERKKNGIKTPGELQREQEAAAIALAADPYDKTPQGLETSFQREQERKAMGIKTAYEERMEREAEGIAKAADPYDKTPQGLETSFAREIAAGRSLENEIQAREIAANEMTDGYDTGRSLPETAKARTSVDARAEDPVDTWGYSLKPMGLETSFAKEKAAGRKLEEEIKAQKNAMTAWEDRFSHEFSTGLETSFARECADVASGRRKSLEQEMKDHSLATAAVNAAVRRGSRRRAAEEAAKNAQEERDVELVSDVRKIYEDHYGTIHTKHQQGSPVAAEMQGRVDEGVHEALKEFEVRTNKDYSFKPDNLEAELASQHKAAAKAQSSLETRATAQPQPQSSISSSVTVESPHPVVIQNRHQKLDQAVTKAPELALLPRREPATYKILAYDVHGASVTTATTFSTPTSEEKPLPLTVSLSGLTYPAPFLPHLPSLARDGFVPVSATSDLLVFRKLGKDDGLKALLASAPEFSQTYDGRAGTSSEEAPETRRNMNPVDGTTPPTGNFASPTGFVNHDPISTAPPPNSPLSAASSVDPALNPNSASFLSSIHESPSAASSYPMFPSSSASAAGPQQGPWVRRTEPVFSGSERKWRNGNGKHGKKAKKETGTARRVLVSAIWAAACCYVVGVVAEVVKMGA
ncbi:hypothetical protein W97_05282 [Coniosporium apollinis CBS 100218]|uniref:Uncharacterized protein n=1 Tax=Coniosporium apollinis (strain CBS 100218) TaxID=1168221 RepID=R7YW50_CONA1|nr:uncharacterized protein W97_05282 [Coniosporium apollinis CBS 100218]EON66039.1 hypothetical protein W97_05282 [Coniosporium apollinis CBS 100218]